MSSKTNININIGALRQESQAITQGAIAKPARAHQSCEVAARLEAPPDTEGGRLVLQATALFDGPHTRAGHTDAYAVRPEQVKACLENLNKGAGFAPGSVLVFGNAWRDQETGVVSIGWVTTAISAQKAKAELNGHQARTLAQVYAQMPVLDFTNVHRAPGEPERIRWPLGLDAIHARVQVAGRWQTVTRDRDWLKEQLGAAWETRQQDTVSLNLRLPVLYPEQAVPVRDLASATNGMVALLAEHPYRSVLTRVSDGAAIATRWQPLMRGSDAVEWAAKLLARTPGFDADGRPVADSETGEQVLVDQFALIEKIDNRLLLDAARRGDVRMEFLPRESLLLATKNAPGLANTVKAILQASCARDLRQIAFAFGEDPEAVSRVALILQRQPDDKLFVVGNPIRLDVGPSYTVATVPSPHLPIPPAPATAPEAEPPLEAATAADIPPLGEEDEFELDRAALDAALAEPFTARAASAVPAAPVDGDAPPTPAVSAGPARPERPSAPPPERPVRATASVRRAPAPGL